MSRGTISLNHWTEFGILLILYVILLWNVECGMWNVECGMYGLMIHTAYIHLEHCERIDKITMGHPNISTQHRCLIANSIYKAIDIACIHVLKRKWKDEVDWHMYPWKKYLNDL
jgi:hypothetical protein